MIVPLPTLVPSGGDESRIIVNSRGETIQVVHGRNPMGNGPMPACFLHFTALHDVVREITGGMEGEFALERKHAIALAIKLIDACQMACEISEKKG